MIDIHCHIVPNIDDGAKSLDDALEMAKIAYDEGIRKIVNTSHYHPNFEYKKGKELFESVKEFNNILKLNNKPWWRVAIFLKLNNFWLI